MKAVTKTAFANLKLNRTRNIISGVAILLTTLLIFSVLSIGFGAISVEFAAVNEYYPTYHVMYRQVSEENVKKLKAHNLIEDMGIREDFAYGVDDDSDILFLAMDSLGISYNKIELEEGTFPSGEKDIALPRQMLEEYGLEDARVGDEITLPFQLVEDGGLGYQTEDTFQISGFLKADINEEKKSYAALFSLDYMRSVIPAEEREYRVMFRLQNVSGSIETTDAIEEEAKNIAEDFDVSEDNVVMNNSYLLANYVDPASYAGIACIILVVVAAGILTIYSIYYITITPKVQEYGRLKAIGATKRQIRQMVFREGVFVTVIALPLGLLIGSFTARPIVETMFEISTGIETRYSEPGFNQLCIDLLKSGDVQLLHWWLYLITIAAVVVTVYLSLVKPMNLAAKISPVEAMRYNGEKPGKKKERKGFTELSLSRLTRANLSRNRKRTVLTVVAMGVIGILFMVVATVIHCADPKEIVKEEFEGDYEIYVDSWENDKMNPDRSWKNLMQNNPLSDEFISRIRQISGVEEVKVKTMIYGTLTELDPEGEILTPGIQGFDPSYASVIEDGLIEGDVTYEELEKGDKIVMDDNVAHWFPELGVGDSLDISIITDQGTVEKTFEIAGITELPSGILSSRFLLPDSVLAEYTSANLNDTCVITVDPDQKEEAFRQLDALASTSPYLETDTYDEHLNTWRSGMQIISLLGYAFLAILGGIGVMNLINTMINSIYTRKRELGMIQAIGLSEKQLIRMLQMEGAFYTAGTLLVALGIGSAAGYGVFHYMEVNNLMNVTSYHYPILPAVILAAAVALIQLILTYVISRNFRRMSLIDRIRYSE